MISQYIVPILIVTGIATALGYLQFLVPALAVKLSRDVPLATARDRFYFRHWGVVVGGQGVLLIIAAYRPEIRDPIILMVGIAKTLFFVMTLQNLPEPFAKAQLPAAIFDAVNVLLYAGYFLGI